MNLVKLITLAAILLLVGCGKKYTLKTARYSDTMEIIRKAAEAAPQSVEGVYTLKIKATGSDKKQFFLTQKTTIETHEMFL